MLHYIINDVSYHSLDPHDQTSQDEQLWDFLSGGRIRPFQLENILESIPLISGFLIDLS